MVGIVLLPKRTVSSELFCEDEEDEKEEDEKEEDEEEELLEDSNSNSTSKPAPAV